MIDVRTHGSAGPVVIALHGGPAACGSIAPVARGLADRFRVLEPWQRGSGGEPLTVDRHVADLHQVVESCGQPRPALVGHSWGAMLALAYAAAHPDAAGPLALIGCGTFDPAARAEFCRLRDERRTPELQARLASLEADHPDPAERMIAAHELSESLYELDPLPEEPDPDAPAFDLQAHGETWGDMVRQQESGRYPAAFGAIESPVMMFHGAYDPHPGRMIRDGLLPLLPQLEYREWERCGHSPWRARAVRDGFFAVLAEWLAEKAAPGG